MSGDCGMIEAAMIWNEPNNKSHWDLELDPDWSRFARMCRLAGEAIAAEAPGLPRVLGGISPIDPNFIANMAGDRACSTRSMSVAVHGFPLDWNLVADRRLAGKARRDRSRHATCRSGSPKVGASSFGAEEVQEFGLQAHRRTADRPGAAHPLVQPVRSAAGLAGDDAAQGGRGLVLLPPFLHGPAARGRHAEARRQPVSRTTRPDLGICQWFHFEDHRLDDAVRWMKRLGVRYLRTGLSWADSFRPNAEAWFDRQMRALEPFEVTVTFCFTPEERGLAPHYTAPPEEPRSSPNSARACSAATRPASAAARLRR